MKALQNNKGIIIAVILFVGAIGAYNLFIKSGDVSIAGDSNTEKVGSDVLALNANIQTVTLNTTLFTTTLYKSLVDFSTTIPNQPVGRHNPFGPIGNESGQATPSSGTPKN